MTLFTDVLHQFAGEMSLSYAPSTCRSYTLDLMAFMEYLKAQKVKSPAKLTSGHIITYLANRKEAGTKGSSLQRYLSSIKVFCQFMHRRGIVPTDASVHVPMPPRDPFSPSVPTPADMQKLLAAPDTSTCLGARDKAILEVLYSSGLRSGELCALAIRDVSDGKVLVRYAKGNKARAVPMTKSAWEAIRLWLDEYRGANDGPLFVSINGYALKDKVLRDILDRYCELAKLPHYTIHAIRHACATHMLERGADIRFIQEILGHSSIATTQRYTHLSSEHMDKMFKQFHPNSERTDEVHIGG